VGADREPQPAELAALGHLRDGIVTSRGFYDVRLDFDKNLRGEIAIAQLNPKNVLIDPDAEDYDPDKWKTSSRSGSRPGTTSRPLQQEDAKLLEERGPLVFMYGYDSIERTPRPLRAAMRSRRWYTQRTRSVATSRAPSA
jgi:hypothetical protein